uniref:hypothetical protein n=1 Tax=Alloprevotella sp. TaxID=1872471 RepID=UPI0040296BCE
FFAKYVYYSHTICAISKKIYTIVSCDTREVCQIPFRLYQVPKSARLLFVQFAKLHFFLKVATYSLTF